MGKDLIRNQADIGVDIVVPVYRVEKYLRRCLDSILNQTHNNFKLIIVDDGSDDKSPEICDEYALKDSRIHVIHKENGGLSSARNAGIDWATINSKNEWITFIDSDDLIHPKFLEYLSRAAYENDVDICRCSLRTFADEREIDWDCGEYKTDVMAAEDAYLLEGQITNVCACAKLYKKKLFEGIRYPIGKLHEDLFTTYKLVFKCKFIAVLPNQLYFYFSNQLSITNSLWTIRRFDEFDAYEEQIRYFRKNKQKKIYIKIIERYIQALSNQYSIINNEKDKIDGFEKYQLMIKTKIQSLIKGNIRYHSTVFPKCRWGYEIAFPNVMRVYWKIKSLCASR